MESPPAQMQEDSGYTPPAPFASKKDYDEARAFKSRLVDESLKRDQVKKLVYDAEIPHPFKRTMVGVFSPAFDEAVKLVVDAMIHAKKIGNQKAAFAQCCNVFWIGPAPNVNVHVMRTDFRALFDQRNLQKAVNDPDFLPSRHRLFDDEEEEELGVKLTKEQEQQLQSVTKLMLFGYTEEEARELVEKLAEEEPKQAEEPAQPLVPWHSYVRKIKGKRKAKKTNPLEAIQYNQAVNRLLAVEEPAVLGGEPAKEKQKDEDPETDEEICEKSQAAEPEAMLQ